MLTYPGSLHNHTEYSNIRLRDCIIRATELIDYAIELGHSGVAITDHECISNSIKVQKYYQKVKEKHPNFKVVLGNEIYLCRNGLTKENYVSGQDRFWHFLLLAKDAEGHKQIRALSTRAWLRGWKQGKMKRVPTYYDDLIEIIDKNKGHLIGTTACLGGYIPHLILSRKIEEAKKWLLQMKKLFGEDCFYLELQPPANQENEQAIVNQALLQLSAELDIPYIISTDSHYLKKEDAFIHKAYLNAQEGDREVDSFYATTYLMSSEELSDYFLNDQEVLQTAFKNTQHILDICEDYNLTKPLRIPELKWKTFSPITPISSWYKKIPYLRTFMESDYFGDIELAKAIVERVERDDTLQNQATYDAIDECLDMTWQSSNINNTHWSAYYLNLQGIIEACWEAGSLVGAGRGSGVGFILLYILDITQINPLRETTKTKPWRFLNPKRASVLDIDLDTEGRKRDAILEKFRQKYGADRVSNVATFGTEKSKAAILTAARGLNIDLEEAQYISSLIPSDRGVTRTLKQCYYGDTNEDFASIKPFVTAMNTYPDLWKVALKIEGLVCKMGVHAGGVIFTSESFIESTSLMTAPDGTVITAYELHDCEDCSLIKYDILSIEALDKIHVCLDLLLEYGHIKDQGSLKETYEHYIGIYNLERTNPDMWKMVHEHKILSLFQMEKQSGIQGIALAKPANVDDLATLNSVIRLMASEKNAEPPLQKFARFRKNINLWYEEMTRYGLTKEEQKILEPILLPSSGICEAQELFMELVQIPACGGFDLQWADRLRKSIAKKKPEEYNKLTKEYFANAEEKGLSKRLCNYVWNVLVATSRGYGFNKSHTLAYSLIALQEMNLAFKFPIIYWNTACLIIDSGGVDAATDYTKMAQSVNRIRDEGVSVSLIDINESNFNFKPDEASNRIMFGLKALMKINDNFVNTLITNRPYTSLLDFCNKVNPKIPEMISLIKAGGFNSFCSPRQAMIEYLWLVCEKKKRITLQNMPGLIKYQLLPQQLALEKRIYEFNRYLKAQCSLKNNDYLLNSRALNFLMEIKSDDLLISIDNSLYMNAKTWDKRYHKYMDKVREWIAANSKQILKDLNIAIFMESWNKYASGSLSAWEMEALCFYYHEHELARVNKHKYGIVDFYSLPEEPAIERRIVRNDAIIPLYKLYRICGTCIAKNKDKGIAYVLTDSGVVTVKFRKEHFALFDRQIFKKNPDGTKTRLESSWFNKGSMIMVQGFRRGEEFVTKKYANSHFHQLYHIDELTENGTELLLRHQRLQGDEETEDI